ncbi:hypothetical protein SAMN05444064_103235 [Pseudomonas syringae]|nr:hypothetical protein SAMN05444514_103235 [Pseudomonas syringae]SFL68975.1 hypothetical protein SAMN05444064_103235 [Pseudomonas syringae]
MAVRRISKRQTPSCDQGLLLIGHQQRAVALIVFRTSLRQQMLVCTQKRVLYLSLDLRRQEALLVKKLRTALSRRRAVGQTVQWVVAIDAEYGSVSNSHGVIPLVQRCGSQSGLTIYCRPASRTTRCQAERCWARSPRRSDRSASAVDAAAKMGSLDDALRDDGEFDAGAPQNVGD